MNKLNPAAAVAGAVKTHRAAEKRLGAKAAPLFILIAIAGVTLLGQPAAAECFWNGYRWKCDNFRYEHWNWRSNESWRERERIREEQERKRARWHKGHHEHHD